MVSDLPPVVAIVILNWNGRKFLEKFLPGVITHSPGCRVIVADNASEDDSVAFLKNHFPKVELIIHPRNLGFCDGYNRALEQIEADFFVLLNSDVEVTANWVEPVLALMQKDPGIAACQPKIKSYYDRHLFEYAGAGGGLLDYLGYPFCRGRLFDSIEADQGQYNDVVPVFWATGACMFLRTELFRRAGGLEPAFFAHMEEIDLCWRLQNLGYRVMYCGQSEVYHVGGGTLPKSNSRKTFLNFRNGFAMLYKNTPAHSLVKVISLRIVLDWVAALKFMADGDLKSSLAVFKAHLDLAQNQKYWRRRRQQLPFKQKLAGVYDRSLVWDYFVKKKRRFADLEVPDRTSLPTQAFPDIEPKGQHEV